MNAIIRPLSSLKLTVLLLGALFILVFVATLDQVNLGIFYAKKKYFESWIVDWAPTARLRIPIFPGGALIGTLLVANLLAAHFTRFKWTWKKSGIWLTHIGLLILIIGSGMTSWLGIESQMKIQEGQTQYYSQDYQIGELAITYPISETESRVVSIPQAHIKPNKTISHPDIPFDIQVRTFYPNAQLELSDTVFSPNQVKGAGRNIKVTPLPIFTQSDVRNFPTAYVTLSTPDQTIGTFLVSAGLDTPQSVTLDGTRFNFSIRAIRYYNPYGLTLTKFIHENYQGTQIPKHFQSNVTITDLSANETRDVQIYMNHPLRYRGKTYYQASFTQKGDASILQVVQNPSWLIPYISCTIMGFGLIIQFGIHLARYLRRSTP